MAASKIIVADFLNGGKLNARNYYLWHFKIQHLLEEQDMLEAISMSPPEEGIALSGTDLDAYNVWKRKDRVARIIILSSMVDDLMLRFEKHTTAKSLWEAIKFQYGETSTTRKRQLGLAFDGYKMRQDHTMRQHITTMSNMISELSACGLQKTDEEQVCAVIKSLPKSWEHMKVFLKYADDVKTFDQAAKQLELEEDLMMTETLHTKVLDVEASKGVGITHKRDKVLLSNKVKQCGNGNKVGHKHFRGT